MKIINIKTICKTLLKVVAIAFFTQAAYAEVTLKLGTTGRLGMPIGDATVSYTHLRAHETPEHLVCRLLLEKKKTP